MTGRYLVTGAQGFIGRYLIAHVLDHFPRLRVLGVGRSPEQNSTFHHSVSCGERVIPAPLPEYLRKQNAHSYSYVSCELSSLKLAELIREFRPTAIIHLAASLRGISDEIGCQNNVRSTEGLLGAIRASGVGIRFLLIASSGGVYGRQEHLPIAETATAQPVDWYSRSKFASENLARTFSVQTGVPTAIARIFNVFGAGQDELHFAGRMAGQIAAIRASKGAPPVRAGLLSSSRDFLDVRDACAALGTVLEQSLEGVCNIASGVETRVGDLLHTFLQVAGLEATVEIQQETGRVDPIPRHSANINRLARAGFVPQNSLAETCREMLNYYSRLVYTETPV